MTSLSKNRSVLYALLITWLFMLLKLTLLKHSIPTYYMHFHDKFNPGLLENSFNRANLTPFNSLKDFLFYEPDRPFAYFNLFGNVLMFVPAGIIFPALFSKQNMAFKIFLTSFCISLGFEILQLFTGLGDFDIDDLMLNSFGGLAGFAIHTFLQRKRGQSPHDIKKSTNWF